MKNSIMASAALVASATASSLGSAIVINKCSYPVALSNVPAANGGYSSIDMTLESQGIYTQVYTELTNGNGWSIKLAKTANFQTNVMQYEYTTHNDGTIWYDMSEVDGNPWDGNWEITSSTATCAPKQQAYRYSTDDAYGMQSCPDDATITLTLCSGDESNDVAAASASSSVASISSYQSAQSTTLAASTTGVPPTKTSSQSVAQASVTDYASTEVSVVTTLLTSVVTAAPEAAATTTTKASVYTTTRRHHWGGNSKRHHARHVHN